MLGLCQRLGAFGQQIGELRLTSAELQFDPQALIRLLLEA